MTDDARRALAADQQALLTALAGGPVPPGFDGDRVALAGRTLLNKRRRSVERRWPALAAVPSFTERFAAYAAVTPLPITGGATEDGRRFFAHLRVRGGLTEAARLEQVVDGALRHGIARTRLETQRFAVAVRRPWRGRRVWLFRF